MLYSALEQHCDGSWWFHGDTFTSREEAGRFLPGWIGWDENRHKKIFYHEKPLPREECYTIDDGETFEFAGITLWDKKNGILKKQNSHA